MNTNKKIACIVVILAVIGGIWYLENRKTQPIVLRQNRQVTEVNSLRATASTSVVAVTVTSTNTNTNGVTPISQRGNKQKTAIEQLAAADKAAGDMPAIDIMDPTGFINVAPGFNLSSVIGKKVILLDFWTYSDINCVRTIPYLNAWYQNYTNAGLEIVSIHTPEFDFEKNLANVQNAVQEYGIHYPVILDNNQGTWNAYNNLYWPHEYLIDIAGYIVHDQVGEGYYSETETDIQKLLDQRAQILGINMAAIATTTVGITPPNLSEIQSPETYFGAARNSLLANGTYFVNGNQTLTTPDISMMDLNRLYLGGTWDFEDQYAKNSTPGATITYTYDAGNVYMVASGATNGTVVDVIQDGTSISAANAGDDVRDGKVTISESRLYNIVKNSNGGGKHTLQLIIESPGLQAYTFTFG